MIVNFDLRSTMEGNKNKQNLENSFDARPMS